MIGVLGKKFMSCAFLGSQEPEKNWKRKKKGHQTKGKNAIGRKGGTGIKGKKN